MCYTFHRQLSKIHIGTIALIFCAFQGPTVFTGNMGNNRYIVQVSPQGVRLLNGSEQIQHLPLELGSPICQASVADPYLVVLTEDGQSRLLTLDATVGKDLAQIVRRAIS